MRLLTKRPRQMPLPGISATPKPGARRLGLCRREVSQLTVDLTGLASINEFFRNRQLAVVEQTVMAVGMKVRQAQHLPCIDCRARTASTRSEMCLRTSTTEALVASYGTFFFVYADDFLHSLADPLCHRFAVFDTEIMRNLVLIDVHGRFPVLV